MKWPLVQIGQVAEVNPRLPRDIDETQIVSFIGMASVSEDGNLLSEEDRILSDTKKGFTYFTCDDVLLAKITPCFENGKSLHAGQLSHDVGFGSTEFHVIRASPKELDSKYLFYLIWSDSFRFYGQNSMSGAAGQKRVSADFIKTFKIPLPPLKEQKRIAAILDKADNLRRKRQQAIQLADGFLRAVFLDMFGDPKLNPKSWEKRALGDLILSGPANGLYKPAKAYGEGARIIRIDGFYSGKLEPEATLKRVKVTESEIEKYKVEDRSILINRVNSPKFLGKCAFVEALTEPTIYESNMMNFRVDEKLLNPKFLVQQLQSNYLRDQIRNCSKDAVNQSSINQQDVKSLQLIVPDIAIQDKFESVCRRVESIKEMYGAFGRQPVFESISQKAFSGEL